MRINSYLLLISCFLTSSQLFSQWTSNGANIYNTNSGNVGIGTNSPPTLLYVTKSTTEPTITIRNLGGFGGATYSMIDDASGANWKFKATLNGGFKIRDHANELDVIVIEPNSGANAIYIKAGGNLGIGTPSPHNSALLDLTSNSKGLLPPRMSYAEIISIPNPADGLLVYCMDCGENNSGSLAMYSNGVWTTFYKSNCMNLPNTPTEGVHVSTENQIVWNWNAVATAIGYKWNTTNDYNSALDIGNVLSYSESALSCNTEYDRYLWAYNNCGHSTYLLLNSSTSICTWECGEQITINHIVGPVAPVSKIVGYGTVTGVPGESSKCWITRNLGSDQQPVQVDEGTEAASGWYWQFNHKQGFKHDGSNRTPNSTWLTSISENSNWSVSEDPCSIELGNGWRLPSSSEWFNIDASDNWTTWGGPWNSILKLHASGHLESTSGALDARGQHGNYWSSTSLTTNNGYYLGFNSISCVLYDNPKAFGFTVRCVKD